MSDNEGALVGMRRLTQQNHEEEQNLTNKFLQFG